MKIFLNVLIITLIITISISYIYGFSSNQQITNKKTKTTEDFDKGFGIKADYLMIEGDFADFLKDGYMLNAILSYKIIQDYNLWLDMELGYANNKFQDSMDYAESNSFNHLIGFLLARYNHELSDPFYINVFAGFGFSYIILNTTTHEYISESHYLQASSKCGLDVEYYFLSDWNVRIGLEMYTIYDEKNYYSIAPFISFNYRTF